MGCIHHPKRKAYGNIKFKQNFVVGWDITTNRFCKECFEHYSSKIFDIECWGANDNIFHFVVEKDGAIVNLMKEKTFPVQGLSQRLKA